MDRPRTRANRHRWASSTAAHQQTRRCLPPNAIDTRCSSDRQIQPSNDVALVVGVAQASALQCRSRRGCKQTRTNDLGCAGQGHAVGASCLAGSMNPQATRSTVSRRARDHERDGSNRLDRDESTPIVRQSPELRAQSPEPRARCSDGSLVGECHQGQQATRSAQQAGYKTAALPYGRSQDLSLAIREAPIYGRTGEPSTEGLPVSPGTR